MSSFALLFPGQGSQYIGMGKGFFARKDTGLLFEEAEDLLNLPLKRLMFDGPVDELISTAIAQPAILLHSIASFKFLISTTDINIACGLGHSLGEYSALVAASVLSFADAIKAVHRRGQLMQQAVPRGHGAMMAVLGMDADRIISALREFSQEDDPAYVSCANFNAPLQTVIAGTRLGIEKASAKLKSLGCKRIIELPVSAPFHCALMKPVEKEMQDILNAIDFADAQFPIISNVSAKPEMLGKRLKELLIQQIANPVRFTDCLAQIDQQNLRGDGYVELGPKDVLTNLVKKLDKNINCFHIDVPEDIQRKGSL